MYSVFLFPNFIVVTAKGCLLWSPNSNKNIHFFFFLIFFLRYHKQAAVMVHEYVQQRQRIFPLSQVLLQLTHFVVDILRLLPSPSASNNSNPDYNSTNAGQTGSGGATSSERKNVMPIQMIAKQASWVLLSDETAFQV